jgi:hypothetical protein
VAKKKGGTSKVDMVRDAIAKLGWDVPIEAYSEYITKTYNVEMSKAHISQTKSTERRKQGVKGKRRRRRRAAAKEEVPSGNAKVADILTFLDTVREWQEKIGAETVREVVRSALKK